MSRWERGETTPHGSPVDVVSPRTQLRAQPHVEDLVRRVETALGRFGAPGQVEVHGEFVRLFHNGLQTRAPLGGWLDSWVNLEGETKNRVATDLARQLCEDRPASKVPGKSTRKLIFLDARMVFLGVLVVGLLVYGWLSEPSIASAPPRSASDRFAVSSSPASFSSGIAAEEATTGRPLSEASASRSCAKTLARVLQGGNVTPADAEGWQVEVSLLQVGGNDPLDTLPALSAFVEDPARVQGSKLRWPGAADLGHLDTPETLVRVRRTPLGAPGSAQVPGVTFTFSGTYVDDYFSERTRRQFHLIAGALSDAVEATHGAVYAKCFDSDFHALGSWFRGLDAAGVVTSLLYFVGTFSTPPHLAAPFLHPPGQPQLDRAFAWSSITEATRHLNRTDLSTLAGSEGGMAMGKAGEAVVLVFPFTDGNRASRLSRTSARVLMLNR